MNVWIKFLIYYSQNHRFYSKALKKTVFITTHSDKISTAGVV